MPANGRWDLIRRLKVKRTSSQQSSVRLGQGWRTCGMRKYFLGTRHSLLSQFFMYVLPHHLPYIEKNMYIYTNIYISDTVQTVYELPLLPNNVAMKHFCINQERCEVFTGYLSLERRSGGDCANRDTGQKVLESSFHTGSSCSPIYCHIFFLIAFLEEAFISNIIITLCINYIIIMFTNYNSVINNTLWNTTSPCFPLQISHGHAQKYLRNL